MIIAFPIIVGNIYFAISDVKCITNMNDTIILYKNGNSTCNEFVNFCINYRTYLSVNGGTLFLYVMAVIFEFGYYHNLQTKVITSTFVFIIALWSILGSYMLIYMKTYNDCPRAFNTYLIIILLITQIIMPLTYIITFISTYKN